MNTPEGWKPNTRHGHVFPRADGLQARCGGPAICKVCAVDLDLNIAVAAEESLRAHIATRPAFTKTKENGA